MFRNTRKQKLRNRVIAAALGVAVMTFGIWLNYKEPAEEPESKDAVQEVVIDEEKKASQKEETKSDDSTSTLTTPESYLIREENGIVKVYLCDSDGNKELYLITSIPFELLSESDQEMFRKGVNMDTEEDLGKFLENFDS